MNISPEDFKKKINYNFYKKLFAFMLKYEYIIYSGGKVLKHSFKKGVTDE